MTYSIIIPIYNKERYLRRCLESIKNIYINDIEFILIDDGSSDGSKSICDEYVKIDNRFRYIYQENKWVSEARNNGIRSSKGEYISFIDADDKIDTLEYVKALKIAKEYELDILNVSIYKYYSKENIKTIFMTDKELEITNFSDNPLDFFCCYHLKKRDINYVGNKIYKSKCIKDNKLFFSDDIRISEDKNFNYRLLPFIKRIGYTDKVAYYYYQNLDSTCYNVAKFQNIFLDAYNAYNMIIEFYKQINFIKLESIYSVWWMRNLQSAWSLTMQATNNLDYVIECIDELIDIYGVDKIIPKNYPEQLKVYSKYSDLNYVDEVKELLFWHSLHDKKDIVNWQNIYPKFDKYFK